MMTNTTTTLTTGEITCRAYRAEFLALFASVGAAMDFETAALSIGRDLLPAHALAVLDLEDDADEQPAYYAWLCAQFAASNR